jgi:hypothetical protein
MPARRSRRRNRSERREEPRQDGVVLPRARRPSGRAVLGVQGEAPAVVERAAARVRGGADARGEGGGLGRARGEGELEGAAKEDARGVDEGEAGDEGVAGGACAGVYCGLDALEVEENGGFDCGVEGGGVGIRSAEELEASANKLLWCVAEPLDKWIACRQEEMWMLRGNDGP